MLEIPTYARTHIQSALSLPFNAGNYLAVIAKRKLLFEHAFSCHRLLRIF